LKLLKIGAVLLRNTRRVRLHLSSAYPYRELFHLVCQRLSTA
ncbi:MAG: transposase, partial [Kiritimatiellae bacterium]|nr:transposase [Kiritimatiellia bacterium]